MCKGRQMRCSSTVDWREICREIARGILHLSAFLEDLIMIRAGYFSKWRYVAGQPEVR